MEEALLYSLKHRFQAKVDLVRVDSATPDFATGTRSLIKSVFAVEAAIEVTNTWLEKVFNRTGLTVETKAWLVDPNDLPDDYHPIPGHFVQDYGLVSRVNDPHVLAVYIIKKVELIDGGMLIEGYRLLGAERGAVLTELAVDTLLLSNSDQEAASG